MADLTQYYGDEGVKGEADEGGGGDFSPLKAGWYPVAIESEEVKPNSKGTGILLALKLRVLGKNRVVWNRINFQHQKTQTQEIGKKELGALTLACQFPNDMLPSNRTENFLGKHVDVKLNVEPPSDGYPASNGVKGWAVLGTQSSQQATHTDPTAAGTSATAPSAQSASAAATSPGKGGMPWDK